MYNEQFRKSITEEISRKYKEACVKLEKAKKDVKENPRSHKCKEEEMSSLRVLQTLQTLIHRIDNGDYDSVEYYDKWINPMTKYQSKLLK